MKINLKLIFILCLLFPAAVILAQDSVSEPFQYFQQERNNINETAMIVLGSWAAGNIIAGTYGNFKAGGEAKYFFQFNAMWNVVNLGIAAFGYINAVNSDPAGMTNLEIIKDFNSLQNFLLLNAGLDAAYIVTGFYLKEKAQKFFQLRSIERIRQQLTYAGRISITI